MRDYTSTHYTGWFKSQYILNLVFYKLKKKNFQCTCFCKYITLYIYLYIYIYTPRHTFEWRLIASNLKYIPTVKKRICLTGVWWGKITRILYCSKYYSILQRTTIIMFWHWLFIFSTVQGREAWKLCSGVYIQKALFATHIVNIIINLPQC